MIACETFKVYLDSNIDFDSARIDRNDPEIMQWTRQFTTIGEEEQEAWAERILDSDIAMFAIQHVKQHQQIGVCGFTSIDRQNQCAEFSLYISRSHQRRGLAKQALYLLFRHGFMDWNFHRIWGETFDTNPAFEFFKKIGMDHSGTFKESYYKRGDWIDSHLIQLLRVDFEHDFSKW